MDVLVEYEYSGLEEDELTIKPGEVITNVVVVSDGWWEGDLNGKRGVFPDNFVRELRREEKSKMKDAPKKTPGSHVAEIANKLGKEGLKMGPAPPSGSKVVKRDQSKRKMRAKVAFSYMPENEDELRLEVGDTVEIIKQEEEGWWEGTVNGKMGMFPSNFVEVEDETPQEKTAESEKQDVIPAKKVMGVGLGNIFKDGPINLRRTGDMGSKKGSEKPEPTEPKVRAPTQPKEDKSLSLKKAPPPIPPTLPPRDISEEKKLQKAKVLYSYVAENEDELSITEGDIVTILETELEDSGWWKGELSGEVGVFPDNFVCIIPAEELKPKKPPPPSIPMTTPTKVKPPPAVEVDHPIQRPPPPQLDGNLHSKDDRKSVPALPSKKPAMPPPPIGKKPQPVKHAADLITQTDDHKAKESQKERGMAKSGREMRETKGLVQTDDQKSLTTAPDNINLDNVEAPSEKLTHLGASRVKAPPTRRPPTIHSRDSQVADEVDKEELPPSSPAPAPPVPEFPESPRQRDPRRAHRRALKSEPHVHSAMEENHTPHATDEAPPKRMSRPPPPQPKEDSRSTTVTEEHKNSKPSWEALKMIEELRQEIEHLRANTVPRSEYESLKTEMQTLKETVTKLNKHSMVLMNDIDEGTKARLNMQVEIDRVKKLVFS